MKLSEILQNFFYILNYQKLNYLKNTSAFILLGIIDIFGILMLGLSVKGLRDFEKTKSELSEYFYFVNLDFLNIQIFFLLVLTIFTVRSIFHLIIIHFNSKFINNSVVKLKNLALSTYLSSKVNDKEFVEIKNVLNFLISRPEDVGKLLAKTFQLSKELLVFISVISLLIYVNYKLFIYSFLIFIIISVFFFLIVKPKLSIFSREINNVRLKKLKIINSVFLIFKESKFYTSILDFKKRSIETDNEAAKIATTTSVLNHLPTIVAEITIIFLVCVVILFQTYFSEIDDIFLYNLVIFLAGAYRIKPFFISSLDYVTSIKLNENSVVAFSNLLKKNKHENNKKTKFIENFSINKISLTNVNYSLESKEIFKKVNFIANKNETIFIYGESGSGKTTLINFLLNFKKPQVGQLFINDKNILDYDYEVFLNKINYLQQEPSIFDGSLKENITLQESNSINFKKLKEVIELTNLNNFVKVRCGNDYDFNLKELGNNLSGGEKQRITLARVMYDPRELIILDEPVKSLDESSQHIITQNLVKKVEGKILIFLSHNSSLSKYFNVKYNITELTKQNLK